MTRLSFTARGTILGAFLATVSFDAARADTPSAADVFLRTAERAAQSDFAGTFNRLCVAPQTAPSGDVAPAPAPDRATWYTEPSKVFDNLYFVGTKIHSSWALNTSDGIILLDTLYDYATADAIVEGLKKVGLDPAKIKYVIISHGHADHVGGAKRLQDEFGAHIVMAGPDWDTVEKSANQYPNGKPRRDIVATDGQKITLGGTSVELIATPGHTPGTLSMLFEVKDNGKPLTVIYSSGTAFNFTNDIPHFDHYINSQRKMARAAADAHASVLLSNHSEFDNTVTKISLLAARKPGEAHPFDIGANALVRYFKVTDECAQLARFKLMEGAKKH